MHRSYTAAVRQCGDLLASLGHAVKADDPAYPRWATPVLIASWLVSPVGDADPYTGLESRTRRHVRAALEPRTRRHVRAGQLVRRVRPRRDGDRDRLRAALLPFFDRHDVLVMPSLAWLCPPARRRGERSWLASTIAALRFAPMTGVWNLAGFPAASLPCPPSGGLPGSVQLVAAPGGESLLLALAAQLERARPWPRHAPPYS